MNQESYKEIRNRKGEKNSNKNKNHKGKIQKNCIIMKKRLDKIKLDKENFKDDEIKYEKYKEFENNYKEAYQKLKWNKKCKRKNSWDGENKKPKTGRIIYKEYEGLIQ